MAELPKDIQLGRMTILCDGCHQQFQCTRFKPYFDATLVKHCVVCGCNRIRLIEPSREKWILWQEVADDLQLDRSLVESLYKIWSVPQGDPLRFIDFVRQCVETMNSQ